MHPAIAFWTAGPKEEHALQTILSSWQWLANNAACMPPDTACWGAYGSMLTSLQRLHVRMCCHLGLRIVGSSSVSSWITNLHR